MNNNKILNLTFHRIGDKLPEDGEEIFYLDLEQGCKNIRCSKVEHCYFNNDYEMISYDEYLEDVKNCKFAIMVDTGQTLTDNDFWASTDDLCREYNSTIGK